jgi:hypothetical protein
LTSNFPILLVHSLTLVTGINNFDMSVVPKTTRPMRIIALPLTRSAILRKNHRPTNTNGNAKSDPALTFYHFQLRSPPEVDAKDGAKGKKQGRIKTLAKWASTKAADTWAGFGKAPEGSWKVSAT